MMVELDDDQRKYVIHVVEDKPDFVEELLETGSVELPNGKILCLAYWK